ncbi:hypothetical protein [Shewanella sp. MTB7]|uniref:hypothetical protein n=1 Tax=Shewanella sp. MTB7 TaxID=2746932 RepID=UPI0022BA2D05|nr:hypothetical protein [Shewanella sp. MTB7]WBJ96243.1 hypothetical protein HWQ47_03695 [Shewanella sp. MTB7]
MRHVTKLLAIMSIVLILNGCAYYVYNTGSAYGLTNVETTKYLGHQQNTGYSSPIFTPIVTLDNGVQVKLHFSGGYSRPPGESDSEHFNNLRIEIFITSLEEGIRLDTQHIMMDQYRISKKAKVNFLEMKRYPSKARNSYGIDVCQYPPEDVQVDSNSFDIFYDFYQKDSISIPYRQVDFNLLPVHLLAIDTNILCGILVAMNTNLAGDQGFFTLTLPFIEEGQITEYTLYVYPVEYRFTAK